MANFCFGWWWIRSDYPQLKFEMKTKKVISKDLVLSYLIKITQKDYNKELYCIVYARTRVKRLNASGKRELSGGSSLECTSTGPIGNG